MNYQVIRLSQYEDIRSILKIQVDYGFMVVKLMNKIARKKTKVDDFVFISIGGDHSNKKIENLNYKNGLIAFGLVKKAPFSIGKKHYGLFLEISYLFGLDSNKNNKTITRDRFYKYKDLKNLYAIGAMTKGEKNQAVSLIKKNDYENIIKALIDLKQFSNSNNKILKKYNISNNNLKKYTVNNIQV